MYIVKKNNIYLLIPRAILISSSSMQDQKRLQGQLIAEQEAIFGSKPSPSKPLSSKKPPRTSTGSANRRMSLGGALLQTPKFDPHSGKHGLVGIASRPNRKDDGVATLSAGTWV